MILDEHTQAKISGITSFITAIGALTFSQWLGLISLTISIVAGIYSIYCTRLTVKKRKLEISHYERIERDQDKISKN